MAAVLACGPGAVLSHVDAALLWGLAPVPVSSEGEQRIHVTIPADTNRRRRRGIALHRMDLSDDEIWVQRRIPVTAASRTILDLATAVDDRRLDEAERLRLCSHSHLLTVLERNPGRPGSRRLGNVLQRYAPGSTLTRSELEERFLRLCRQRGLPAPLVNASILGLTVDFLWPPGLVAELDGAASHLTRRAFQDDRDRDSLLVSNGYRVLRFTWFDVVRRPAVVVQRIRRALGSRDGV